MSHAVVLLSGGVDSTTCFAFACEAYKRVTPVHVDYGQQTEDFELMVASRTIEWAKDNKEAVIEDPVYLDYTDVFNEFAEGVASDRDSFVTDEGGMEEDDGRSTGYVPMRNLHFIASAGAIADVRNADAVFHGAQFGDEAAYPDCREEFMNAAEAALNASLPKGQHIELEAPLLNTPKSQVVQYGEDMGVPWEFTYSCYTEVDDLDAAQPCGACPACIERAEAFFEAGVDDPFETIDAVKHESPVEYVKITEEMP